MLDKKYIQAVREELLSYALKRREVIKMSGDAQQHAKKAIFALQREDNVGGQERLKLAEKLLLDLYKKFKLEKRLLNEGSYKAAIEEYVEAAIFNAYINNKPVGKIKGVEVDSDAFISGLCDVPGELYRYAIHAATARNFALVKKCHDYGEEIIGELIDMDLTGYHRTKFDQAKQAMQKLEQVVYEVSLRT